MVFIILWTVFKQYVVEGSFNILFGLDYLYLSFFDNLNKLIIRSILTYFGFTLFSATDVINQMIIFTLKLLTNTIAIVIIPFIPGILIFRDLLRGNEEYKFTKEEQEDFNELKL